MVQRKWKNWYQTQKKYIKWAAFGVLIVIFLMLITTVLGNHGKVLKDQKGQYYREMKQGNRTIQVPVFENKKLNEEAKKYQNRILRDEKVDSLTYELKPVGDLTQVIWTKKEKEKEEKEIWVYHQKEEQAMTLKQIFKNWNQNTQSDLFTFLNLEWNRMLRTLTPPVPSDHQIQEELQKAIDENHWYLENDQEDFHLYFEITKENKNYKIGIPFYVLKDQIDWDKLGISKEEDKWFRDYIKDRKVVAFTFDDGPNPNTTPTLITEFHKRGMNATFYMLGRNAEKYPEVVKMVDQNGFEIGSHTYQHRNLKRISDEEQKFEIQKTIQVIQSAIGKDPTSIRPPYGNYNDVTLSYIETPIVLWNVDTWDWKYRDANVTYQNSIDKIQDGSIILFHDIYYASIDAAVRMADELYQRGYVLLSIQELARAKNVTLTAKTRYYQIQ